MDHRGHEAHEPVDTVAGRAGDDVGRHHRADGGGEAVGARAGGRADDVALGDDAFDGSPILDLKGDFFRFHSRE